tara:strand:+ start:316 stop:1233 length:918 start_codon:yes stop_codon:yes gene_type:complete
MANTKITNPELFNLGASTSATQLPVMTTTQRIAMTGLSDGEMIFNSTTDKVEYFDGTKWYGITSYIPANTNIFNDNSCIAYYRFNGNADDETGNYNATASNETYSATGGKQGGYIELPQSRSGTIDTNDSGFLSPHGSPTVANQSRSYSMWVQFPTSNATENLVTQWRSSPTPRSTAYYIRKLSSNKLHITMYGNNNSNQYAQFTTNSSYTYATNTFYNIVLSVNTAVIQSSTSRFKVWVNGVFQSVYSTLSAPSPSAIQNISSPNTTIGSIANPSTGAYANFDEFRVFNRVLTDAEAVTLYQEF